MFSVKSSHFNFVKQCNHLLAEIIALPIIVIRVAILGDRLGVGSWATIPWPGRVALLPQSKKKQKHKKKKKKKTKRKEEHNKKGDPKEHAINFIFIYFMPAPQLSAHLFAFLALSFSAFCSS